MAAADSGAAKGAGRIRRADQKRCADRPDPSITFVAPAAAPGVPSPRH